MTNLIDALLIIAGLSAAVSIVASLTRVEPNDDV